MHGIYSMLTIAGHFPAGEALRRGDRFAGRRWVAEHHVVFGGGPDVEHSKQWSGSPTRSSGSTAFHRILRILRNTPWAPKPTLFSTLWRWNPQAGSGQLV